MLYCFQVQVQCSGLEPLPGTYWAGSGTRLGQVPGCVRYQAASGMTSSKTAVHPLGHATFSCTLHIEL